jgi:hypothetical protein
VFLCALLPALPPLAISSTCSRKQLSDEVSSLLTFHRLGLWTTDVPPEAGDFFVANRWAFFLVGLFSVRVDTPRYRPDSPLPIQRAESEFQVDV